MFNKLKDLLERGKRSVSNTGSSVVSRVNNFAQKAPRFNDLVGRANAQQVTRNTPQRAPSQFRQALLSFAPIVSPLSLLNKNVRNQQAQNFNQVKNTALTSPKLNFVDRAAQKPVVNLTGRAGIATGKFLSTNTRRFGQSAGDAMYSPFATKSINQAQKMYNKQGDEFVRQAKLTTDPRRKALLLKSADQSFTRTQKDMNVADIIPSIKKSNKQIIGEAGGMATEALGFGAIKGVRALEGLNAGIKGMKAIPKLAAYSGLRGVEGAGYGALNAMADNSNVAKGALIGGIAGAGANTVLSGRLLKAAAKEGIANSKLTAETQKQNNRLFNMYKSIAGTTVQRDINASLFGNKYTSKLGNKYKMNSLFLRELAQADTPQKVEAIIKRELAPITVNVNQYNPDLPAMGKSGGFARSLFAGEPIKPETLNTEHAAKIYQELDTAMAGKRFGTENGTIAMQSSFPNWIPSDLRKTPLLQKVKEAMLNNTRPSGKAGELYDITRSEIQKRDPLNFLNVETPVGVTRAKPELPTSLEESGINTQKPVQPGVSESTPQTTPASQTPIISSQKTSSYPQDTPLLTGRQDNLLPVPKVPSKIDVVPNLTRSGGVLQIKNNDELGVNIPVKVKALSDVSPETVKDINGIDASFKSVYRNFEKAFGDKFEAVKRRILDPFDASKGNMVREQEQIAQQLKDDVVDGLNIKKGSRESALVQQYGEGNITLGKLLRERPNDWQKIVEADKWFRKQYDTQLAEVNAVRARIYPNNPDKQIMGRKDYYRHFQELTGMEGLKNLFDSPANIPTELAGISDTTQPKSKFLSFAQKRLGLKTKDDAVGGFINYMRSATYAKHIDQHIEKFRGLADELTDMAERSETPDLGSRFAEYLRDYANDLSGKTNPLDRSIQKITGRKVFAGINWLNSRVKANVILGNLSSAVAQAGNTPQMAAKSGYRNWAGGFKDFLSPKNNVIDSSNFIKERYSKDIFDQFDSKILDQPKKAAVWITQALDEMATKIGWNGFYRQAVEKGVSNPTKYADDLTRAMVGGRGIGEVPLIQKSKVTQLVAPFQLEVQNLMQGLGKEVSNKELGVLVKYALAAYAFNFAAKQVRGNGVTFDPIQASMDAAKAYQEEDNKGIGALKAGGRLGGELFSNMMGGQTLASLYPEYGVKMGGETVTRKELFGSKDPTRFGQGLLAGAVQNPLYKLVPPFGGAQVEKTIKGLKAYSQGYSADKSGNVQFPIDKNPMNLIKSAMFGKYSTGQAREYFDKNRTALGEKQSGLFKSGAKTYQDFMSEREQNKSMDKLKSGKKTSGTEDLGNDLYQVGDKFYSKSLDKEFNTREKADEAINGESFLQTGKAAQVIGDKIYRKDNSERGYAITTKISYDTLLTTQKLENAKIDKNLNEWAKLYDVQRQNLLTQLNDSSLDELEKGELQQKLDKLDADAEKYAGYGGFTKPKKGKKAKKAKKFTLPSTNVALSSTLDTYKNLQSLLGGITSKSASKKIGRKVILRKQRSIA